MDDFKQMCILVFHVVGPVAIMIVLLALCASLWSELGLNEQAEKAIERQCGCVCAEGSGDE